MKGLLLKDAYQIWHYAKGVIVATVVMMGAGVVTIMNGANFFIVYAGFLMGMMPMTLLAYDQASKFSEYSGVLPVTKEHHWPVRAGAGGTLRRRSPWRGKPALDSCGPCACGFHAGAGRHDNAAEQCRSAAVELPFWLRKGKICVLSYGRPGCGSDGVWRVRQ